MTRTAIGCPACGERRWVRPVRPGDVAVDLLTAAPGLHTLERQEAGRVADCLEAGRWRCVRCGRPAGQVVRGEIEDVLREIGAF